MPQKSRKICFVVAADITLKFILISELRFFRRLGYGVSVVCSPGKWLQAIKEEGFDVKEIPIYRKAFTPFSDLVSLWQLLFYFKRKNPDVVLTFTPKPGLLGQLAARAAGVPVVINTIFGYYFHENMPWLPRKFFIVIEKIAARCSSFIFFRNQEDFETAKKEHIIKQGRAEYIGDGIAPEKFNPARFSPEFIQQKKQGLGIAQGAPVIGIVARLVKEKGYVELFEAFNDVLLKFPDTVLLVIGPAEVQKRDGFNPLDFAGKNIVLLGERTDVDELLSIMDIFVLPSYREGFPHSVMEASAMALPIITTNVRGCRDAVEHGKTGLVIEPKNPVALARALEKLLSDLTMAKSMGQAGRQKAKKDFDKNVVLQKMEEKITRLLP